jgi:hypothetical protein
MQFQAGDDVRIDPADWAARADHVRQALMADDLPANEMVEALNSFRFLDDAGRTWMYDGLAWSWWDGTRWMPASPPGQLRLQPFQLEWMTDVPEAPPAGVAPLEAEFEGEEPDSVPPPPPPPHIETSSTAHSAPGSSLPPPPPPPRRTS